MTAPDDPRALKSDSPRLGALLSLNNAFAAELSLLTRSELERMVSHAFLATTMGEADAFLLAFREDAPYESPNFRWFCARLPRFVYIDRVVVAPHARGRGLARRLYDDLFETMLRGNRDIVCCEVNISPPNPVSDAFHAAMGFAEIGSTVINGGAKTVRYLETRLSEGLPA